VYIVVTLEKGILFADILRGGFSFYKKSVPFLGWAMSLLVTLPACRRDIGYNGETLVDSDFGTI
jgi:hypothetical protein